MSESGPLAIFDRAALRRQRARAAAAPVSFLHHEVARRLVERLDDVRRQFPQALDLGCRDGELGRLLAGRPGVGRLVQCDAAPALARLAAAGGLASLAAEEEALPFRPASFDLVLSSLALHWVNDLPGCLLQLRQALKPDGLLLAALLAGDTLHELRQALLEAEIECEGGAGPRVSPFADLRELGGLLQRAGLALPVADGDTITVTYGSVLALLRDLKGMGEANALIERRRGFSRRATLLRALALYEERFADADGRVPATFQVAFLTGWAPHPSQPAPLKPGSALSRLAAALGGEERPAGDKARPRGRR